MEGDGRQGGMEGWRQKEKQEGWKGRMGTQREGWMRRMGEGWKKGWKEECDRWVVPGQSWEGAERLASQGERTHTNTHTHTHTHTHTITARIHACAPVNSSHAQSLLSGVFSMSFPCVKKTSTI